jgi:DNA-binding winged helix-turn-helix (wHTH) protein
MASQKISNKNQSAHETAFRFGEFRLYPAERMLKQNDAPVPLTAKALDTLLCLVEKAGRLVTKEELMETVWPETYVAEANLTNAIVSLRKAVGKDAISTVSKYGYRFEVPVDGAPGVRLPVYETFSRANELTSTRSAEGMQRAQYLYWTCLAEDPGFAPAWAWLARTCAFLAKISGKSSETQLALADAAMKRAFAIDADLACAHQFYTSIQTDTGEALHAIERLGQRLTRHPSEPETHAGLVQALRYCGLLDESVESHSRAADLDPAIVTSVSHTYFLQGEFHAAVESYGARGGGFYLDAAAWAALGDREGARLMLAKRLAQPRGSPEMLAAMASLLAIVEERFGEAVALMEACESIEEPETLIYFARHFARIDRGGEAVQLIRRAGDAGFVCAPQTLRSDPWLEPVRMHPWFGELLRSSEEQVKNARAIWQPWEQVLRNRKEPGLSGPLGSPARKAHAPGGIPEVFRGAGTTPPPKVSQGLLSKPRKRSPAS